MHKRFCKLANETKENDNSGNITQANVNLEGNKSFETKKYVKQKQTQSVEVNISDTSNDELQKDHVEESSKWLPSLKRYSSDSMPPKLMHRRTYQSLSISITTKSQSQAQPKNIFDVSTCSSQSPIQDQLEEENPKWLPNHKHYNSDPKPLTSMLHNNYQPLSSSVTAKSPSETKPTNAFNVSNCSFVSRKRTPGECRAVINSIRETLTALNRNPQSTNCRPPFGQKANGNLQGNQTLVAKANLQKNRRQRVDKLEDPKLLKLMHRRRYKRLPISITTKPQAQAQLKNIFDASNCTTQSPTANPCTSQQTLKPLKSNETMTKPLLDCTPTISPVANMGKMVDRQHIPQRLVQKKERCTKGGYLYEFNSLMLNERMDRRMLAHNPRLGISSGQRVQVLAISESFGVRMAQVKPINGEQDKENFNIIISPAMAAGFRVGATVELYFDLKPETALKLPNNELVYVQPNKLLLL